MSQLFHNELRFILRWVGQWVKFLKMNHPLVDTKQLQYRMFKMNQQQGMIEALHGVENKKQLLLVTFEVQTCVNLF